MRVFWLITLAAVGCNPAKTSHETTIVGVRTNRQGDVIQEVVRERTVRSKAVLLAPDGPAQSVQYEDKYFLQAKDKSKYEVPMTRDDEFRNCKDYRPVEGSPLWVGAGINPLGNENTGHVAVIEGRELVSHNENDLHLVVFDEKHVVIHRTFSVVPKWESSEDEFRFTNDNRTVIFRSPEGFKTYDVLANTVDELRKK